MRSLKPWAAILAHGLSEAVGGVHYKHDPKLVDKLLYDWGYNRVYDTLEMEANLDDISGELVGYVIERLFDIGALDVFCAPIYMKKNRPATQITVLAPQALRETLEEIKLTAIRDFFFSRKRVNLAFDVLPNFYHQRDIDATLMVNIISSRLRESDIAEPDIAARLHRYFLITDRFSQKEGFFV